MIELLVPGISWRLQTKTSRRRRFRIKWNRIEIIGTINLQENITNGIILHIETMTIKHDMTNIVETNPPNG